MQNILGSISSESDKAIEAWGLYNQWSRRSCYYMDKCSRITEATQKQ